MYVSNYTLRSPTPDDVARCFEIETAAYEGDEAATCEKIARRVDVYPEGFMVLETSDGILGFINSGAADRVDMADESFKELIGHNLAGKHSVILSMVVHPDYQGWGIASILMQNFILRMRRLGKDSVQLMCRERYIGLYAKYGFKPLRESLSTHGGLKWHEMELGL
ncbi:MAG: N-acetyltransferase [Acidihalobacter sp.]